MEVPQALPVGLHRILSRANSNMEKTAEVVIIGGGVIGVSIAYHLAIKKAGRIVLFEKGQLGEGSTSRCVGRIRTQFSTEINIRFSLESLKTFERFEKGDLILEPMTAFKE